MKEKLKIENSGTVSILDGIGCGCGSCDDDKSAKASVKEAHHNHSLDHGQGHNGRSGSASFGLLDDIGCGCGSCEEEVKTEQPLQANVLDDIGVAEVDVMMTMVMVKKMFIQ